MHTPAIFCLTVTLIAAGCRDGNEPRKALPLAITTDSSSYTRPAGSSNLSVEVGFTNNSAATIWVGSCGPGYSSRPGTSFVLAVYGVQLVSYATTPPTVSDIAPGCSAPIPYALAPGTGVRMGVILGQIGRFAFSAPFSTTAGGAFDQRTGSADFTIIVGS